MGNATCNAPDCDLDVFTRGLCTGHHRQRARGLPLRPLRERLSPWDRLVDAALDLGNLPSAEPTELVRASANLRSAARAWARSPDGMRVDDECACVE